LYTLEKAPLQKTWDEPWRKEYRSRVEVSGRDVLSHLIEKLVPLEPFVDGQLVLRLTLLLYDLLYFAGVVLAGLMLHGSLCLDFSLNLLGGLAVPIARWRLLLLLLWLLLRTYACARGV
jgi:hypothetical protein